MEAGAVFTLNIEVRRESVYTEEVTVRGEFIQEGQARRPAVRIPPVSQTPVSPLSETQYYASWTRMLEYKDAQLFVRNRVNRRTAMRLKFALLLVFVIACGGTPGAPEAAFLRFTPREPEPGSPEAAAAEAGQGRIAIRATLSGPDPCRTLEGQLDHTGRDVVLRVFIRPSGARACVQVIGRFAYDAVIEGLPRGTYVLQVVHTYPSTGWPTRTVLSQTVDAR